MLSLKREKFCTLILLIMMSVFMMALYDAYDSKASLRRKIESLQAQVLHSEKARCGIAGSDHIKILTPQSIVEEPIDCISVGLQNRAKLMMCVHSFREDSWVSGELRKGGIWEEPIVQRFLETLNEHPAAIVLDVGAQLGTYGLHAASLHRTVIMVEAMQHNANHILHSLRQNNMTKRLCKDIFLVNNAASSVSARPFGVVYNQANNNGATAWSMDKPAADFEQARRQTTSIRLDELLPLMHGFDSVVMKIDIEGSECEALKGIDRILAEKKVVAIFMEAGHFDESRGNARRPPCDLTGQLKRLEKAGLTPTSFEGAVLNVTAWESWPWDFVWLRR